MQLRDARVAVQQGSPTYHKACAALTQLASDCHVLADRCEARAQGRLWVQNMQSAVAAAGRVSDRGERTARSTAQTKASSPVEVTIDGLNLRIDDSEASCARLHYDSGSAVASVKEARLNILFKVQPSLVSAGLSQVLWSGASGYCWIPEPFLQSEAPQSCHQYWSVLVLVWLHLRVPASSHCFISKWPCCPLQVLFQRVPVLAFSCSSLSYNLG